MEISLENMLQKNPSKNTFYENVKMSTKGPFVVEFLVVVGTFDCDCTHLECSHV
jgi:hypothetical protein